MRRRLAHISLFIAWFFATGSHWDFVQTFAWTKMFVGYVSSMPLGEALQETFDANKRCALCKVVSQAKQNEQTPAPSSETKFGQKITLVYQPTSELFVAIVGTQDWREQKVRVKNRWRSAPPVPPPRPMGYLLRSLSARIDHGQPPFLMFVSAQKFLRASA